MQGEERITARRCSSGDLNVTGNIEIPAGAMNPDHCNRVRPDSGCDQQCGVDEVILRARRDQFFAAILDNAAHVALKRRQRR